MRCGYGPPWFTSYLCAISDLLDPGFGNPCPVLGGDLRTGTQTRKAKGRRPRPDSTGHAPRDAVD